MASVADSVQAHPQRHAMKRTVGDYVALTKPRIIELLLVTTVPTMLLAARGLPSAWIVCCALVGGTLAAGSANVLNCYLDRDIDALMRRTKNRPIHREAVAPRNALVFGVALGVLSAAFFAATTNELSAVLAVAAIAFYVGIYTAVLKRRTSANIVWGGAAGCMPVLIGWAAVRDSIGWAPAVLFLVVFLWTPPHFWALAMRYRDDYARAGVPMLPVVATEAAVARQIVWYSWGMVAASFALWPVAHTTPVYPVVAALAGAAFLREAHALRARTVSGAPAQSMRLFHWSITYLSVLFFAVAADAIVQEFWR